MRVQVKLFATLAGFLPSANDDGVAVVDLHDGATVGSLTQHLGLPDALSRIVLVNGHDVEDDHALHDGDVVDVFPPLAGGAGTRWYTRDALEASRNPVGLPDFKSGVRL